VSSEGEIIHSQAAQCILGRSKTKCQLRCDSVNNDILLISVHFRFLKRSLLYVLCVDLVVLNNDHPQLHKHTRILQMPQGRCSVYLQTAV